MNAPKTTPAIVRALKALQFVYDVMPPEVRLLLAQHVGEWAERARVNALADMGRPPPDDNTFTTHGQPRPHC